MAEEFYICKFWMIYTWASCLGTSSVVAGSSLLLVLVLNVLPQFLQKYKNNQ